MKIKLDIIIEDKKWKEHNFINKKSVSQVLKCAFKNIPATTQTQTIEVALLLTNNAKMQEFNAEFRKQNKPTNVLSFPDVEINPSELLEFLSNREYIYAGDIAMGYDIILEEALDMNIEIENHFVHLLVHGFLHLFGYDHTKEEDSERMKDLEIKILDQLGIKSPY